MFLMVIPGPSFAGDLPVAQELRAVEAIRTAEEKADWFDGRRIFYFDQIRFDDRFNNKAKEELTRPVVVSQR